MKEENLIKFLNKRSSPREEKEFYVWLSQPGSEKALEEMLQKSWAQKASSELEGDVSHRELLQKIHKATAVTKRRIFLNQRLEWRNWIRTAATYLLLCFSAYILFQMGRFKEPIAQKITTIEKIAKAGEKIKITLPDESTVLLNSLSKITFRSDFGQTHREVDLEGEAYFKIAPDPHKPFLVKTNGITTTALGTAFNAFSKKGNIVISLVEGRVRVSHSDNEVELIPGESAILQDNRSEIKRCHFDPDVTLAWKEGKISFKSKPFKAILVDLESWYAVQFDVAEGINLRQKVTGEFDNDNLNNILNGLSFSLNFEYYIDENSITLSPKP